MAQNDQQISLSPLKITVIYLIVAGLWIAFTDRLLESLVMDARALSILQTYKGWLYVLLTGGGLYWLITKHSQQLQKKEVKLENLLDDIQSEKELKDVLFERIPILITIYDPNLEAFEVNKEFEKVTGWTNEEITEQNINILEAVYPDLETRKKAVDFMNNPGVGWKEFTLTTKKGDKIPTSWTDIRLTDNTSVGIGIDMTEIKASQAKIRESRELLKKIFESLESSLIVLDPQTRTIVDCNSAAEKIFGYNQDELIGSSTRKLHVDDESYQKFDEIGAKALEENGVFQTEFKMKRKDGTPFYSDHTVTLVYDEDGEVNKAVSVVRDITERKKLEKELKKEKQRFQLVAQTTSDVIWDLDFNKKELWWSQSFNEIFGYERKDLHENYHIWKTIVHPEDREKVSKSSTNALKSDAKTWEEEYRIIKSDESIANIVDRAIIIRDDEGNPLRMVGAMDDVTDRKKAERQLLESEEKYRHLFENNPEPMWIYDPDTLEFVEINQAAISHYGYTEEEFLNMTLLDIRPEKDIKALRQNVKENIGSESYSEEWTHLKKDGTEITVELSAADVKYHNGQHYRLVLINDVTEQKKMQEKIIQSVIEGEDRERKRIAHELHDGLGQYLVAANMNLQSAKTDIEKLTKKRQNQFETGVSLLKNALSETRSIAHNLMPKAISDYGLIAALENLIKDFRKSTDINFRFTHNCDQLQLNNRAEINIYRIFQEIITNAIRHAECSKIDIRLQMKDDSLKLMIKDNGIGAQLNEQDEETGLGLRSIKTRVSSLKGSLDINSEPGKGMKTSIIIPEIDNLKSNHTDHG